MVDISLRRKTAVDAAERDYANDTDNYNYCALGDVQSDEEGGQSDDQHKYLFG